MNKTLYCLAYRNIIKYKKHYIFVSLIILFISIFYSTYTIVQTSYFQVNRLWNEQEYGSWYFYGQIAEPEKFDKVAYHYEEDNGFQYTYLYLQGVNEDGYNVAYADKEFNELCKVDLIEGHFPSHKNEIVVSQELLNEEKYQLGNTVQMMTTLLEMQEYKIVGVVHNSQENYFADIYTNINSKYERVTLFCDRSLSIESGEEFYSHIPIKLLYNDQGQVDVNKYGYDHSMYMLKYLEAQFDLAVLLQLLVITSLVLIAFASASLKQRSHEFALLRGLGMTSKQLMLMNLYEYAICVFLSIVLGTLMALFVSYGIMFVIKYFKDIFIIIISPLQLCINAAVVLICIIMTLLYPISKSSRHAMSGTFDSYRFQYIQIRYRRLHYQNKWRLAWRELKVNKKIHILFIVALCFHTSFILMNMMAQNYNNQKKDITYIGLDKTKKLSILTDYHFHSLELNNIYYTHSKSEVDIVYKDTEAYVDDVYTCDDDLLKKSRIEGRFPMNDYEILIHNNPQLYLTYNNGYHEILDIQLSIGDSFQLNGQDVTVVGIVQPAEILKYNDPVDGLFNFERYYLSTYTGIYVTPSLYQTINGVYEQDYIDIYYQTENEKNIMISQILNQYPELLNNIEDKNSIEIYSGSNARSFAESSIHSYVLYASLSICIFLCYFINKNEMFNRRNDYALCQLIGMTKKDLLNKQIAKGIIIFVLVISIQTFFVIMECTYLDNWTIPYMEFIILSLFVFVICLLIYVTPLYFVLKHKPLDNLRKID